MANWTVSQSSVSTTQGATVSANVVLTITPNTGYVISASQFKIGEATNTSGNVWSGGNVDIGVNTVTFADVGTPGTAGNTVTATVAFDSFTMPSNDKILYIDIDEVAETPPATIDRYVCIRTQTEAENENAVAPYTNIQKHTVTYNSITGVTTGTPAPSTIFNLGTGYCDTTSHATVTEDPAYPGHHIVSITFAANTTFGYYYNSVPTYAFNGPGSLPSAYNNYFVIQQSNLLYETDTTSLFYNELIGIQFDIYYTPPTPANGAPMGTYPDPASAATSMCELGQSIIFDHTLIQSERSVPGIKPKITGVSMGSSQYPNTFSDNLAYLGGYRNITVIGDDATCEFNMTIKEEDGHTYDFTTDSFTSAATQSSNFVLGSTLQKQFSIRFPVVTSDSYYDVWVTPVNPTQALSTVTTPPGFQSPNPTQVSPYAYRLYQLDDVTVSLGFEDPSGLWGEGTGEGDIFHASDNTKITLVGRANTSNKSITKTFSYTVEPGHLDAGSGTLNPTTSATTPVIDFGLRGGTTVVTKTDGAPSSATFDVDSTSSVAVGDDISWSIQKTVIFANENTQEILVGQYASGETEEIDLPVNNENIVTGMRVTGGNIRSDREVLVEQVGDAGITLSESVEVREREVLTFTAQNITVNTVTDANTLVASQSLSGVTNDLDISVGGGSNNSNSFITGGTATKVGSNIVIAGTLNVTSFGSADIEVKLDISKLILIT